MNKWIQVTGGLEGEGDIESWNIAKMVFVLSFVILTQAIVYTLAGPIAVPAPFPGGKTFYF